MVIMSDDVLNGRPWAKDVRSVRVEGVEGPLLTVGVGALARALHRSPNMIRRLEENGFLPVTNMRRGVNGRPGAPETRGRRVYTIGMVDDAVAVAKACGVLYRSPTRWDRTRFGPMLEQAWSERTGRRIRCRTDVLREPLNDCH